MKYFIFLLFGTILSEITFQSVHAVGQQLDSFEKRSLNKVNAFNGSDSSDGIIILAALRRRSGTFRGKHKKVISLTTEKEMKFTTEAVKLTTEAVKSTTEVKPTTEAVKPTTEAVKPTTEAVKPTTEAIQFTAEEVIKVTTEESVKVTKDTKTNARRNRLSTDGRQNDLWLARKRVTRPPKIVQMKKVPKVNVLDEEDYSVRRARYLFTQRLGK